MKNHNGQNENYIENASATEEDFYNALIELGWLLPRNEKELQRAEKALETVECPPFPPELEDPAPLIERLRKEQENDINQNSGEKEKAKNHLQLVPENRTKIETEEDSITGMENMEVAEGEETAASFAALIRREVPEKTPSVAAENMGVTRTFLKLVSDNRESIPNSWRDELAKEAKAKHSIAEWRSKQTLTKHSSYQQIAASRSKPYSNKKMDWQEILQKSGLTPERELHFRHLAEEEEKKK